MLKIAGFVIEEYHEHLRRTEYRDIGAVVVKLLLGTPRVYTGEIDAERTRLYELHHRTITVPWSPRARR